MSLVQVQADIAARDQQDRARATAPLRPAEDATVLDTTFLTPDQAFEAALRVMEARTSPLTSPSSSGRGPG